VERRCSRGMPRGAGPEMDPYVRAGMRARRERLETGQRTVRRNDQPGGAVQDGRDQVLLLFGPPSIVAPDMLCVPVRVATFPNTVSVGVV
jgi:hypothetical protein